jgi:dCMP deaminase
MQKENSILTSDPARHQFPEIYMRFACDLARRSTCKRLQVGCVIVADDFSSVYGIGYNGNARGFPNTCDSEEPGNCGCLHAEDNALLKTNVGPEISKTVFVSHQPCLYCAKRIINKGGVKRVYYREPYRNNAGVEALTVSGIEVIFLK